MDLSLLLPLEVLLRVLSLANAAEPQFYCRFAASCSYWNLQLKIYHLDGSLFDNRSIKHGNYNTITDAFLSRSERRTSVSRRWPDLMAQSQSLAMQNHHLGEKVAAVASEIALMKEEISLSAAQLPAVNPNAAQADLVHLMSAQIKEMQQQFKLALEKFRIQSQSLQDEKARNKELNERLTQLKTAASELASLKEQLPKTLEGVKMLREKLAAQQAQLSLTQTDLEAERRALALVLAMLPEAARAQAMTQIDSVRKATLASKQLAVNEQQAQTAAIRSRGVSMLFRPPS